MWVSYFTVLIFMAVLVEYIKNNFTLKEIKTKNKRLQGHLVYREHLSLLHLLYCHIPAHYPHYPNLWNCVCHNSDTGKHPHLPQYLQMESCQLHRHSGGREAFALFFRTPVPPGSNSNLLKCREKGLSVCLSYLVMELDINTLNLISIVRKRGHIRV